MVTRKRPLWPRIVIAAVFLLLLLVGLLIWWASRNIAVRPLLGSGAQAEITLQPDFAMNVFAADLAGPRFMAVGPDGVLHVAERQNDRIVALPDADGDGVADEVRVVAADLNNPHSLVYHEGYWYVGIPSGVVRLYDSDSDGVMDERTVLVDDYPTSGAHSTRTVEFLPDGRMVVSIGSSCNVCEEEDQRRAAIVVYDDVIGEAARGESLFATGLRNAVGLAVHPQTGELWATNNGRDLMGDDLPPETLYVVEEGANYGWPVCHSGDIIDPDMGFEGACEDVQPPVVEMQAHSAPLGLTFYDDDSFPAEYQGDLFIAFHGSWNRTVPTGYKIVRLPFENGQPAGEVVDFASGWLEDDGSATGRPVDVIVGDDGALYVSDDKGGFIYRIHYSS